MTSEGLIAFFDKTVKHMRDTLVRKNNDYTGNAPDPFANFSAIEKIAIGTQTEQGFMVRMTDKFMRIGSFVSKKELLVKDESVTDTLIDLANYCILFAAYIESKKIDTVSKIDSVVIPKDAQLDLAKLKQRGEIKLMEDFNVLKCTDGQRHDWQAHKKDATTMSFQCTKCKVEL